MKKLLVVIFVAAFGTVFSQTGWYWQNPLPTGNYLTEAVMANNNIYINAENTVLKSTNLGTTWTTIKTAPIELNNYRESAYYLNTFDDNNFYMLGNKYHFDNWDYSFYMLKSSNAGTSWDTISIPYMAYYNFITAFKFITPSTGYFTVSLSNELFKSTNAGINWQKISINGNDSLSSLYFINQNTGFISSAKRMPVGGQRYYYRTTNGGASWTTYITPSNLFNLSDLNFVNELTGWSKGFYKTTNGGINFSQSVPWLDSISRFGFINENSGWAEMNHKMYKTSNGGMNWVLTIEPEDINYNFSSINFRADGNGFAVGPFGVIYKSTDFAQSWNKVDRNPRNFQDIKDIDFIDANTGLAVGYAKILRTTNGGNNWMLADSVCSYSHVKFINQNIALVSAGDYLGRSTDAGATWQYTLYGNYGFFKFTVFNENLIYTIGNTGIWGADKLFKSTDKGLTWTLTAIPGEIYYPNFINSNTGWGSGEFTNYKTTNGGNNWFATNQSLAGEIYFQNETTWWGIRDTGLCKTTDAGITWVRKLRDRVFGTIIGFNFANQNTGYAFGGYYVNSVIYKTTDGGETWHYNSNINSNELTKGYFSNANTGWIVGRFGTIIKTTTGGTIGVKQISTTVPDKFYLEQNYPNPFNPVTNIEFSLPQKSFVKLKVFDLLGREIANLVNENLSAGSYKYDFNASALPSGIYFYKLETQNFSETRKMVLIK